MSNGKGAKGGGFATIPNDLATQLIQQLEKGTFPTPSDPIPALAAMAKAEHAAAASGATPNPVELTMLCIQLTASLDALKAPKSATAQQQALTELVAVFTKIEGLFPL